MPEIKLSKRYKYAGDIFPKLIEIGFDAETAEDFLNSIQDSDVVEVVRCKDCEYYVSPDRGYRYCSIMSNPGEGEYYTPCADHYCSCGERKE